MTRLPSGPTLLDQACAAAAPYAHDLHRLHLFPTSRAFVAVPPVLRTRARDVLPLLLGVAELDAAPRKALALVETLYADEAPSKAGWRPWQMGLITILRRGMLSLGHVAGQGYSPRAFVSQVAALVAESLPDAPRAIYALDVRTRRKLHRAFDMWPPKGAFVDADESNPASWRPAERATRTWVTTCGLRMGFLSQNARASRKQPEVRRVLTPLTGARHEGKPTLAGVRLDHDESDTEAVLRVTAAGHETFSTDGPQPGPGEGMQPDRQHWRVARDVADVLIGLLQAGEPGWTVSNAMRIHARDATATLLGVAYFTEAMTTEIARATRICDRWLDVTSGGLPRWQAAIVWTIEQQRAELTRLRAAGHFDGMSALIREGAARIAGLPQELYGEPTRSLDAVFDVELTTGRSTRRAVSAHGLAHRWCDAHGVDFPQYRSTQRPRGSARRVSARR